MEHFHISHLLFEKKYDVSFRYSLSEQVISHTKIQKDGLRVDLSDKIFSLDSFLSDIQAFF
jgi:hypothetical protein